MGHHAAEGYSDQDVLDRLVEELAHERVNADATRLALTEFHADDPSTIHLAHRLLTSGHNTAREATREYLKGEVEVVQSIVSSGYGEGDWKKQNVTATSPHIKHAMLAFWNLAELASVTTRPAQATDPQNLNGTVFQMHQQINPTLPPYDTDYSNDESYWRGLAALTLTELPLEDDPSEYINDYAPFVQLAARCPETPRLVWLAWVCRTLNVQSLEEVLKEEQKISPSLRDGIL